MALWLYKCKALVCGVCLTTCECGFPSATPSTIDCTESLNFKQFKIKKKGGGERGAYIKVVPVLCCNDALKILTTHAENYLSRTSQVWPHRGADCCSALCEIKVMYRKAIQQKRVLPKQEQHVRGFLSLYAKASC